ncbi:MAG: TetR/AcrR family transcriptional regulator [Chloroflexi bacterium]|nr:TetR/AcrR family transcriptional regulator [Chloroflexota bacterium]
MSTKDPRIKRTLKLLSDTLIDMVSSIGYELVQVSDLVIKAGISKSTFYRHFLDKDNLLKYVMSEIMRNLIKRMLSARSELEEAIVCFQYLRDHPKQLRLYLNLPLNSPPRQVFRDAITQLVLERYQPLDTDPQLKDMAINHILASTDAFLEWYRDNLDDYSPEEAARMYLDIIIRAAVRVAFEPREEWLRRFE